MMAIDVERIEMGVKHEPVTAVPSIHGTARPNRMSKMLLPMELDTAMSPCPLLATARLESASGMEVPAARSVSPMTGSGIPVTQPNCTAIHTMMYE